ncbi:CLIP-associating protein isoform X2 [Lycorma delicatula]|uniref:CLIP-associating protein isoform X2 n=1 Tax=Lycorma delicatula TaxID=130591 RepID=UPI003F516FB8
MGTPKDIDGFLPLVTTNDTKRRLSVGQDLLNYLMDPSSSIQSNDIGQIIDGLLPWINSSNFKVSQLGLDIMCQFVNKMGSDFRAYIPTVISPIMDRLGDSKDMVRERCQLFLLKCMEKEAITPTHLFDRLNPCFTHKNTNVRDEVLNCLTSTLDEYGTSSFPVSKYVQSVIKLLNDPSPSVRDNALNTLATMYRHIGDRLKLDLQRKYTVPPAKLPAVIQKFDELRASGDLLPTAVILEPGLQFDEPTTSAATDEPDKQILPVSATSALTTSGTKFKRAASVSPSVPLGSSVPRRSLTQPRQASAAGASSTAPTPLQSGHKFGRSGSIKRPSNISAGAVDEEFFIRSFEESTDLQLFSAREVEDHMNKIKDALGDSSEDWSKRCDAIKKVRYLILAGANNFDEFYSLLRLLEVPFQNTLRDLRSQVVREACITIAFLSKHLQSRFDHFAETILQPLMNLIMNSAKVVASAGLVTLRFILAHTHSSRFVPIILLNLSSKSKDIRRATCEFLDLILHSWSTHMIEKHVAIVQDAIKKGIADADSEARSLARKAFWGFKNHFPEQSESLLKSLDPSYKRALLNESGSLSSSNSSCSLNIQPLVRSTPRTHRQPSEGGSTSTSRRGQTPTTSLRSNSAIDLQAAQRAKARAQYAALARQKVGSGASLPRARKLVPDGGPGSLGSGPERVGRTRVRVSGVSQSQPSSRSGSPSSRLNYTTYSGQYSSIDGPSSLALGHSRRCSTSTPRSTGASRETSPNRYTTIHTFGNKIRARSIIDRPPIQPTQSRPVMAQKILQQSLEAESALAEALNLEPSDNLEGSVTRISSRKSSCRPFEDHSDDSETSSVCSERSFDSFRRPSDDINEIIANCESTHWSDRKEGLVGLQSYLQAGNLLQPSDLKRVTDNFTKMFMDSHTKVFSLFLDTLNDLIIAHRTDLNFWLYILLTRLLNKLGGDLLGSIQNKIHKSLDVVRTSFPSDVQMSTVLRFLCDATQTPNARVKTAACNYITKLAAVTDPGLAFLPPSPGQVKDTATAALTKMIGWTMGDSIKQGSELRRAAQEAIIALFNLNTPQVTLRFSHLPKEYQEAAANLIQGRVRRSSGSSGGVIGGGGSGCSPPMSPASPTPTTVPSLPTTHPSTPPSKYPTHIDAENLNPEEVYRSLRRTTAEIQNYSYESGGKKIDREETSQDSGISQMSSGGGDACVRSLSQHMEDLSISRNQSNRSSSAGRVLTVRDCNGVDTTDNINQSEGFTIGGQNTTGNTDESEAMRKVVESLKSPVEGDDSNSQNCLLTDHEKKVLLTQLIRLIRESSCVAILDNFKSILRVLLTQLGSNEPAVRSLVLASLTEMMKKRALADSFNNYVELLVLKVLQAFKDGTKEVQRSAEICAATIASLLAPELVIRVLVPLITTGDYPVNLGAIKTLTKLVETRGRDPVQNYLPDLMPGLIQAYDNEESSVRKSAVFCMVALHTSVGEDQLRPHLSSLNGSKLKLLHLYIRRAQQGSSVPTSPKNQPSAS